MRELRDAVDIADRPHVVCGAQAVIDGDPAGRDLDAELLETEPFDVRAPSGRDEQPPALDLVAVGEMDADPRLDLLDADAEPHVDALLTEPIREHGAGIGWIRPSSASPRSTIVTFAPIRA